MGKNWGSFIRSGQPMAVGDYLLSSNGIFAAVAQADSNFVIYHHTRPDDLDFENPLWGYPHPPDGLYAEKTAWTFVLSDEAVFRILWKETSSLQSAWPATKSPKGSVRRRS